MTEENRDLSGEPVQQPKLEYEFTWRQAFRQFLDERPEVLAKPDTLALVELAFINGWCSHDAWAISVTCGRIWEQMSWRAPTAISVTVDAGCRETIEAMAMAKGWVEEITDEGDGWIHVMLCTPDGAR